MTYGHWEYYFGILDFMVETQHNLGYLLCWIRKEAHLGCCRRWFWHSNKIGVSCQDQSMFDITFMDTVNTIQTAAISWYNIPHDDFSWYLDL